MKSWFGNLRLAYKLGVGFGVTIALMLGIIGIALNGVSELKDQIGWLSNKTLESEVNLARFTYASSRSRMLQYRVAGSTGDAAKKLNDQVNTFIANADEALKKYEGLVVDPQDRKNFDELKQDWNNYKSIWSEIAPKIEDSNPTEAFQLLEKRTVDAYSKALVPATDKMVEWREERGRERGKQGAAVAAAVAKIVTEVGFVAVVLAAFFGWIITNSITRPLKLVSDRLVSVTNNCISQLTAGLQAFAGGDLRYAVEPGTDPVPNPSKDEVGKMAATFNAALAKIQTSISCYNEARSSITGIVLLLEENSRSVADTSQGLAASAEESGASAGDIAQGSEKLARDATSAAAIMEELAAQIGSARGMEHGDDGGVAGAAKDMSLAANDGNKAVSETVAAMQRVQQQVTTSALKVQELDAKGKEIGLIVQSIEGIAGQTNLLALNAAIEAARAGEHGRGFAVVADEVRKLAEKATLATQEISNLINGITATVADTVVAIEATKVEVDAGSRLSASAGDALRRILDASNHVAGRCEEMSSGAEKVVNSIASVAAISEESASGAEQLSAGIEEVGAAASELSIMSGQLRDVVSRFKIEEVVEEKKKHLRMAA
jgi:methyl-accepting chemotaxis protein